MLYLGADAFPKVLYFLLLPLFTRYLGADGYGIIGYTTAISTFLLVIGSLSLNTYVLRHYWEENSEEKRSKLIGEVFSFILIWGLILALIELSIGFLFWSFISKSIAFTPFILLTILSNYFDLFLIIPLVQYRMEEDVMMFAKVNILKALLLSISTIGTVVFLDYGLYGYYIGRFLVISGFGVIFFFKYYNHLTLQFNFHRIKVALIFVAPLIAQALAGRILDVSDKFLLERQVTLNQLGIYSIVYALGFAIQIIIKAGYMAFEPKFYKINTNFQLYFSKIEYIFLRITLIGVICISLFSREILLIMASADFVSGYNLVPVIAFSAFFNAIAVLYGTVLIKNKDTKHSFYATLIGTLVNVTFNLLFIPVMGIAAAAYSTLLSFAIMALYIFICTKATVQVNLSSFVKYSIIALLSMWLIQWVNAKFQFSIWYSIGIKFSIGLPVLLIVIYQTGFLRRLRDV